ncbi:hypothetical protein [Lacrimispora sp.]|uniref:hypothetical protein n=1 Tax=Lacrimispora sp. TaxID=2719234 RepID=UPI0028A8029C|nr:hypothetical protein [Lacrimispora sp.]
MYKVGDTCYFIESNIHVIEGVVRSCKGGMYIVKYGEGKGIRLPERRLYGTREEAIASMTRVQKEKYKGPYDYE